ncbi:hypothetical protein ASD45_08630 [Pseudolabrys sp. Root1462]|nr:hypothetical protein ASD45_08630 [Pseudolabrys sp. Root1462]
MIVDATITVGNIIEISVIVVGGVTVLASLKNTVFNMKTDITDMKIEIRKVGEVLVKMAVTEQRISNVEQDVRDLRHGHGFVQRDINGEYPPR